MYGQRAERWSWEIISNCERDEGKEWGARPTSGKLRVYKRGQTQRAGLFFLSVFIGGFRKKRFLMENENEPLCLVSRTRIQTDIRIVIYDLCAWDVPQLNNGMMGGEGKRLEIGSFGGPLDLLVVTFWLFGNPRPPSRPFPMEDTMEKT